jgi:hypothetical protein
MSNRPARCKVRDILGSAEPASLAQIPTPVGRAPFSPRSSEACPKRTTGMMARTRVGAGAPNLHRRWRRPSSTRSDVGRRSAIRPLVSAPCLSRGSQQGAAAPLGRMTGPRPPATLFARLRPSRRPPATGGAGRRGDQREPRSRGPAQGHPGVRFQKTDWGRGRPVSPRDFAEMRDHAPAPARASGAQANTANDGGRLGIPGCPKAGRQCGLSVRPSANERPAVATSAPRLPTMTASRRQRWQPTK